MTPGPIDPRRAFRHPLWWAAAVLLVTNDHVLKGSEFAPAWLTGKLSDFVGLLVAPAVLAWCARVKSRRGWLLCHLAVGLGFSAINVFEPAARGLERVTALTPIPWHIVVDSTDLVALLVLPISFAYLLVRPAGGGTTPIAPRLLQRLGVAFGALACTATSAPPCEDCELEFPPEWASLMVGNATSGMLLVRIRPLEPTVVVDCQLALRDPGRNFSDAMFGAATPWSIEPGRAIALSASTNQTECSAYMIEAAGLPPMVLAWNNSQLPNEVLRTEAVESPRHANIRTLGSALTVDHANAHRARQPNTPTGACRALPADDALDWSSIVLGDYRLTDLRTTPDGCEILDFDDRSLVVCGAPPLPFEIGESVSIRTPFFSQTNTDGLTMTSVAAEVALVRGSQLPRVAAGAMAFTANGACSPHRDECSNTVLAGGLTAPDGESTFLPGESFSGIAGETVHLIRAHHNVAGDVACEPGALTANYVEYVTISGEGQ